MTTLLDAAPKPYYERDGITGAGSAVAARATDQSLGGGAIPTSALHIHPIPWQSGKVFVREHHYLHTTPAGGGIALGIFADTSLLAELVGVMLWTQPAAANRLRDGDVSLELRRMIILDVTTRNAESRCLGFAARYIKRVRPDIRYLLSYSDIEGMGHKGTIYKAAGWSFDGRTKPISWKNRPGRRDRGSNTTKLRWRKTL